VANFVLASSAVDRGFVLRSGQTKDYKIGICCFSAKHAALRSKCKGWLALHQNNVSEWGGLVRIRGRDKRGGNRVFIIEWVNEWLLLNVNSSIFQLYQCENKLISKFSNHNVFPNIYFWKKAKTIFKIGSEKWSLFWRLKVDDC
jgi:hypothetical protein